MRRFALVTLVLLVTASPLAAGNGPKKRGKAPPVDPELVAAVEPLVKKLDHRQFAVREEATLELMKLGPDHRPAVLLAKDHPSPEVRMRIRRVLLHYREVERRAAMATPATDGWPMLKRAPDRGASAGPALRTMPEISWVRALPARVGKPYFDSPLVADDRRLYAATRSGQIAAVDRVTGEIAWVVETGEPVFAGPVMGEGRVFVPGKSLTALNAQTGKILWQWKTDYGVVASPLVHDGLVYAVEKGEKLVALDPKTGEQKWRARLPATRSAPVVAGKLLVVGTEEGVRAVDLATGRRRWSFETEEPVAATPALLPDRIVVGDTGRAVYAITSDRGREIWRRRIPEGTILETPTVYGDAILFSTSGGTFRAIRAANGIDLWTRDVGAAVMSSPCVAGGIAYFTAANSFWALDCANGDDMWRLQLVGGYTSPILLGGVMHVMAQDGVLLALKSD